MTAIDDSIAKQALQWMLQAIEEDGGKITHRKNDTKQKYRQQVSDTVERMWRWQHNAHIHGTN